MMNPATYNITDIWRGGTWRKNLLVLQGGVGSYPQDLTGYTASMSIYLDSAVPFLVLTTSNGGITLGGTDGTISLYISAVETATLISGGQYELDIVDPVSGDTIPLLIGSVTPQGLLV